MKSSRSLETFDIPEGYLKTAAEMFIYYNLCPKFMYDWTKFFMVLLRDAPPDVIILNLNRVLVIGRENGDKALVDVAKKIFENISHQYSLQFKEVDAFTKQNSVGFSHNHSLKGIVIGP